jgi:RHS repeat-associated protein
MRRIAQIPARQGRAWLAQLLALALALTVISVLELPLAATRNAQAVPPPPPTELVAERTASSRTFDNHDGTYTTTGYSGPIHYRDTQGAWRPISSALVPSDAQGYAYENEANRFRALFKQQLGPDFLGLETGGGRFTLSAQDASASTAQPRARGISYPGAFSGVDLRYELLPDGLKETLRLANAQAPTSYHFTLSPPAGVHIHAVAREDGSWAFYMAPHARPVFVLEAPWVVDDDSLQPATRHATLDVTRSGGDFQLDLTLDASWLNDPQRQFPVTVDPTVTIQPAFQDASFNFNCLSCTGVGGDRLMIGTTSAGVSPQTWRSALQFSLADIPAGTTVSSAKLKVYFDGTCLSAPGGPCGGTSHQINAYRMTNSWSVGSKASTLNWGPSLTSFTLPANAPAQWMNWDITSTVQSWVEGPSTNFGLLLKRFTEPSTISGPKPPSHDYAAEPTLGPKLEVTYNGDGGQLLEPETVHSNGAELHWIPYGGPGAPPFTSYEVHRSTSPNFTPSTSTQLTKILDPEVTSFRDTTAKAGASFTYKVLVNGVETNRQTVTMPADGTARKALRPDPSAGLDTYITQRSDSIDCTNRGAVDRLKVGTDAISIWRSLLRFHLGDIGPDATISDATLSLWHPETTSTALNVRVHRVTANWLEGSGIDKCTGDGATWYESDDGVRWMQDGGDFDAAAAASLSLPSGSQAGWSQWSLTSLAQQYANNTHPDLGLLLKLDDETRVAGKSVDFYSSDFNVAPTLRPKLVVNYSDGSHAISPTVSVAKPSPSSQVSGTSVTIAADAFDDRRVENVQYFVDGNSVGTDLSAPFAVSWNSSSVGNGSHSLTARATDDAGNQTTSTAVSVTVGNSAPPTTSVNPPSQPASGTVIVTANASDDFGVAKVELYADGLLVGTDTTPNPWSFTWNTLAPALPAYDGQHTLTTKAYDTHGQVTTSAPVTVTVNNRGSSWYYATITTSTLFPQHMAFDRGGPPQQQYTFQVQVTNTGTQTLPRATVALHYRWLSVDTAEPVAEGGAVTFPFDLQPLVPQTVQVVVDPPSVPPDMARNDYRLRFDLFDSTNGANTWFAEHGNKPLEDFVPVGVLGEESTLGIEPYFEYDHEQLGLGMENLVNVATGNSIVRWTPFHAPGIGLSTDLELTYNSLDQRRCSPKSRCPIGPGWSLGISNLVRFGAFQFVRGSFVDADGTWKDFDCNGGHCTPPAGTHLYMREVSINDLCPGHPQNNASWAVTRPDRVTYYYDEQGGNGLPTRPVAVRDKNGNVLCFETGGEPPGARVEKVYDKAGRFFELDYDGGGAMAKVVQIKDHLGHTLEFSYDGDGRLATIAEVGGTDSRCANPDNRCIQFGYTAGQLSSVTDPRNHATTFTYYGDGRLHERTDRESHPVTTFQYPNASETQVIKLLRGTTTYHYQADKSVDSVTNPLNETTTTEWWPSREVKKVTEPGPRFGYTEYAYDQNGLVTMEGTLTDANGPGTEDDEVSRTVYEYDHISVDQDDESISQLKNRTDPNGVPSNPPDNCDEPPVAFVWRYCYDQVGNLTRIVDPTSAETLHTYNSNGTLASTTDANGHVTSFENYDTNGLAQAVRQVMDPNDPNDDLVTRYDYDEDGLMLWSQDPLHEGQSCDDLRDCKTVNDYDSFHRLVEQSSPKGAFELARIHIWTETEYDPNDNVVTQRQASYAQGAGPVTTLEYTKMDQQKQMTDPVGAVTTYQYDDAVRLWKTTLPRGVSTTTDQTDFVTENVYDGLDRIVTEIRYPCTPGTQGSDCASEQVDQPRKTYSCYQTGSGDLLWVTAPNTDWSGQGRPNCNTPDAIPSHTTRYTYDDGHRQLTETTEAKAGGELRTTSQEYDPNGNVITETDEEGTPTDNVYTQRDELVRTVETFTKDAQGMPDRRLTTAYRYDDAGNLVCEAPPRAWDSGSRCDPQAPPGSEPYITEYQYDEADRLVRIDLPTKGAQARTYIHNGYDKNGNLTMTTLPVEDEDPGTVDLDKQTNYTYWDPGWIRSSDDHVEAPIAFDYRAEGWQTERDSKHRQGNTMSWDYNDDGTLYRAVDRGDGDSTYTYDLDKNATVAFENQGQGDKPRNYTVESGYNGFDEASKTREQSEEQSDWTFTAYKYDRNGNVISREDDGTEQTDHTLIEHGRLNLIAYDWVDEQILQDDLGRDWQSADPQPNLGDRRLERTYDKRGWQGSQTLSRYESGWSPKTVITSTYFANGDLAATTTTDGDEQNPTTFEHHALSYEQLVNGTPIYVNGNRTSDSFTLHGGGSGTACESTCTTDYKYGVRENLTGETRTRGQTTTATCYKLDPAMNVTDEWELSVACPAEGSPGGDPTRHYDYLLGNQLTHMQDNSSGKFRSYFYDDDGNLACVTLGPGTSSDCPDPFGAPVPSNLEERFSWHYQNRLEGYRKYGETNVTATYQHDPFDRLVYEKEEREGQPDRVTTFIYQGLTDLVSSETIGGQETDYTYDADGGLVALTRGAGSPPTAEYGFGANVHTDISLLVDIVHDNVYASYGYKAYGAKDVGLTTVDTDPVNPINPYRFNAKRYDPGSTTLDMGVRRYNNGLGRFIQQDLKTGSSDDLGLAVEAVTQNRYSFALADPINRVETDGHASTESPLSYNQQGKSPGKGFDVPECIWKYGPDACLAAYDWAEDANVRSREYVRSGRLSGVPDNTGDAFRHCYWCALMTMDIGKTTALGIGRIHEERRDRTTYRQQRSKIMDLHNNALGASFGEQAIRLAGTGNFAFRYFYTDHLCLRAASPGGRLWILLNRPRNGLPEGTLIYPSGKVVRRKCAGKACSG